MLVFVVVTSYVVRCTSIRSNFARGCASPTLHQYGNCRYCGSHVGHCSAEPPKAQEITEHVKTLGKLCPFCNDTEMYVRTMYTKACSRLYGPGNWPRIGTYALLHTICSLAHLCEISFPSKVGDSPGGLVSPCMPQV